MIETVVVLAKEPVPGRVKTRLVPPLTHVQAAAVARAALSDTLTSLCALQVRRRVVALDGEAGSWLPPGWDVVPQRSGGLDLRLTAAFLDGGRGPTVVVGMDTPQLRPHQIAVFDPLVADACLGLCPDGGYWAVGLRDPAMAAALIPGVPMSTDQTGSIQHSRLVEATLRVQILDTVTDVDTIATAREVAALVPASRFADAVAAIGSAATQPVDA